MLKFSHEKRLSNNSAISMFENNNRNNDNNNNDNGPIRLRPLSISSVLLLVLFLSISFPESSSFGWFPRTRSVSQNMNIIGWKRCTGSRCSMTLNDDDDNNDEGEEKRKEKNIATSTKGMDKVVVVQTGCGCCHGRDITKASIRACRDAIEYNSIKIRTIIPGGYDAMRIHVQIGVPNLPSETTTNTTRTSSSSSVPLLDLDAIAAEFPYGQLIQPIDVVMGGGLLASNGMYIAGTSGQAKDDLTLAVACVTIGYNEKK